MQSKDTTVRDILKKLGISELLNQTGVTEVSINRPNEVFIEKNGHFERIENQLLSFDNLHKLASTLCILNSKKIDFKTPMHSVTLPDGERCHIMISPSCESGTVVFSFRKPSLNRFNIQSYIDTERITKYKDMALMMRQSNIVQNLEDPELIQLASDLKIPKDIYLASYQWEMLRHKANFKIGSFFKLAIENKLNICMVGGTGSGKTAFTKALVDLIPKETRIITIEDTHELDLPYHPNHAHLFYKEHITAKEVVAACMRLKPDRIMLTELRGDEAWDYLSALNTGHPGGITSVHANDCISAFYRIAQLAKESSTGRAMDYDFILKTVKSTIDIVCFFEGTHMIELYFDPVEKIKSMMR